MEHLEHEEYSLSEGDKFRLWPLFKSAGDSDNCTFAFEKVLHTFVGNGPERFVVLSSSDSLNVDVNRVPIFRNRNGLQGLLNFPPSFSMPEGLLKELLRDGSWFRTHASKQKPSSQIAVVQGKVAAQLPLALNPALGESNCTAYLPLNEIVTPLVGLASSRIPAPLDDNELDRELSANARVTEQALIDLENMLNLRPEQISLALVRPLLQILTTHSHLVGAQFRSRLVKLNARFTQIYNRSQAPELFDVIQQMNQLFTALPKR